MICVCVVYGQFLIGRLAEYSQKWGRRTEKARRTRCKQRYANSLKKCINSAFSFCFSTYILNKNDLRTCMKR